MKTLLLNLIINDILNLIWTYISPDYKYLLNKYYFNKYYCYRLHAINNYKLSGFIGFSNNFNNYSYYYYILTNDLLYISKNILTLYINNNNNKDKYYYKKFVYKNLVFYNLVDFFYYYCNNKNEIINIINKYNLSHLIKKSHKNNANKNIRWTY
jgi:hypothetical protein